MRAWRYLLTVGVALAAWVGVDARDLAPGTYPHPAGAVASTIRLGASVAGHRYWRLAAVSGTAGHSWYTDGSANYWTLWELGAYTSPSGGTNLAPASTASASSAFSAAYAASYAVDGAAAAGNRWASSLVSIPQWIALDFGAGPPRALRSVQMWTQRDAISGYLACVPRRVSVAWSDDGATWTIVATLDTADAAVQVLSW